MTTPSQDITGLGALPDAVARLATSAQGPYLAPHHLEAAERLGRMFERASLRQRVTMSYDPGRVGQARGNGQADLSDTAADARKKLAALAGALPSDCWSVLVDVCLYDRGLQEIEGERGWPRRAAKLVLRIGLDQVAALMRLDQQAAGPERSRNRNWLEERLPMFGLPGN